MNTLPIENKNEDKTQHKLFALKADRLKIRSSDQCITIESSLAVITAYLGHSCNHVIGVEQTGKPVNEFREEGIKSTGIKDRIMAAFWTLFGPTPQEAAFVHYSVAHWVRSGSHESFIDRVIRGERSLEQLVAYNSKGSVNTEDMIPVGTTDEEWASFGQITPLETTFQFFVRIIDARVNGDFYERFPNQTV